MGPLESAISGGFWKLWGSVASLDLGLGQFNFWGAQWHWESPEASLSQPWKESTAQDLFKVNIVIILYMYIYCLFNLPRASHSQNIIVICLADILEWQKIVCQDYKSPGENNFQPHLLLMMTKKVEIYLAQEISVIWLIKST